MRDATMNDLEGFYLLLKAKQPKQKSNVLIKLLKTGIKNLIDDVDYRRGRHAITEIRRTLDATEALKLNDLNKVGLLMNQSHDSLRWNWNLFN